MANYTSGQIGQFYPRARDTLSKFFKVSRTDTTGTLKAALPKYAILVGAYVIGGVASDAASTATISVGTTTTANEYINGYDVKTAATATGYNPAGSKAVGTAFGTPLTSDVAVYAKYAETGTASTTGGPWIVKLEYFIPGTTQEGVDD